MDGSDSNFASLIRRCFEVPVVVRALIMSAIVGIVLVTINHGDCICAGKFGMKCWIQSGLTFLVPYTVSTISSVLAISCNRSTSKSD